jgi:hypothetical protein
MCGLALMYPAFLEPFVPRAIMDISAPAAARCATLAQEANDPEEREHYTRLRYGWITLAKRCERQERQNLEGDPRLHEANENVLA